jgi:hypothetical protein
MRSLLCFVALVGCSVAHFAPAQGRGNVTILGDVTITGALRTATIRSRSLIVDGSISVTHAVSAESLTVGSASVTLLETTSISSPTGVVRVSGQIASGSISSSGPLKVSSFLQNDVRQWALVHHDDFEQNTDGWSTSATNSCDGIDHHLGGHCNEVNGEVKKTFSGLGDHQYVRLQARYHFLDSWEGETAFAKIGDQIVWTDVNDVRGMYDLKSLCAGEHPDNKLSVPIDVTIRHTGPTVDVAFGSTLDEHPCNESFGIDDVIISVR